MGKSLDQSLSDQFGAVTEAFVAEMLAWGSDKEKRLADQCDQCVHFWRATPHSRPGMCVECAASLRWLAARV